MMNDLWRKTGGKDLLLGAKAEPWHTVKQRLRFGVGRYQGRTVGAKYFLK
jgi:hypothetical protein